MFRDADLFPEERTCHFSPCRTWRYSLRVIWEPSSYMLPVVMLNPSTADELKNDPTVERVQRRAQALKYGGIEVLNLFAYRATDPDDMKAADDPVGPENDAVIRRRLEAIRVASRLNNIPMDRMPVMVGWGNHGSFKGRDQWMAELIKETGVRAVAVAINERTGQPKHPLYVGYKETFKPWPR